MKETLIIAIILGAFALLASLRAARLDAANAAKPRRNGRTGGKESAGKGAEQGRLRPTILRTAAVGMAVLAIGITLTTWSLLRTGVTPPTLSSVRIGILVAGAAPSSRSSNAANAENNTRNPEPMTESLVIAAILAICAVILWLRPQSISTLSGNPEENPEINWRAVRRIGAGGLLLLAVVIGGGSWLLLRAGVEPQTITVLGILLLFIGAIGLTAAVELCKNGNHEDHLHRPQLPRPHRRIRRRAAARGAALLPETRHGPAAQQRPLLHPRLHAGGALRMRTGRTHRPTGAPHRAALRPPSLRRSRTGHRLHGTRPPTRGDRQRMAVGACQSDSTTRPPWRRSSSPSPSWATSGSCTSRSKSTAKYGNEGTRAT